MDKWVTLVLWISAAVFGTAGSATPWDSPECPFQNMSEGAFAVRGVADASRLSLDEHSVAIQCPDAELEAVLSALVLRQVAGAKIHSLDIQTRVRAGVLESAICRLNPTRLSLRHFDGVDEALGRLKSCKSLRHLRIDWASKVTGEFLALLRGHALESLSIAGCMAFRPPFLRETAASLVALRYSGPDAHEVLHEAAKLGKLTHLYAHADEFWNGGSNIARVGDGIAAPPALKWLAISGPVHLPAEWLQGVLSAGTIAHLSLERCIGLSTAHFERLDKCSGLEVLSLVDDTPRTLWLDAVVREKVSRLKQLQRLTLRGNVFAETLTTTLTELPGCTHLSVFTRSMTGDAVRAIAKLEHLEFLSIAEFPAPLQKADLEALGRLRRLKHLDVLTSNFRNWALVISELPALTHLLFRSVDGRAFDIFETWGQVFPKSLVSLSLVGSGELTDKCGVWINRLPIARLHLNNLNISHRVMESILSSRELEVLTLTACSPLDERTLKVIASAHVRQLEVELAQLSAPKVLECLLESAYMRMLILRSCSFSTPTSLWRVMAMLRSRMNVDAN